MAAFSLASTLLAALFCSSLLQHNFVWKGIVLTLKMIIDIVIRVFGLWAIQGKFDQSSLTNHGKDIGSTLFSPMLIIKGFSGLLLLLLHGISLILFHGLYKSTCIMERVNDPLVHFYKKASFIFVAFMIAVIVEKGGSIAIGHMSNESLKASVIRSSPIIFVLISLMAISIFYLAIRILISLKNSEGLRKRCGMQGKLKRDHMTIRAFIFPMLCCQFSAVAHYIGTIVYTHITIYGNTSCMEFISGSHKYDMGSLMRRVECDLKHFELLHENFTLQFIGALIYVAEPVCIVLLIIADKVRKQS